MPPNRTEMIIRASEQAFAGEATRKKNLDDKAEKLVGAVAAVAAFRLVTLDGRFSLTPCSMTALASWLAIAALVALGASLALAIVSKHIRPYDAWPLGRDWIDKVMRLDDDDEAGLALAAPYIAARDTNAAFNDERAAHLAASGALLLAGFLLAVLSYVVSRMADASPSSMML